jgi:hypothetical protein
MILTFLHTPRNEFMNVYYGSNIKKNFHYTNAQLFTLLPYHSFVLMSVYFFLISPTLPKIHHRLRSSFHISDKKQTTQKYRDIQASFLFPTKSWQTFGQRNIYTIIILLLIFQYTCQYILTITENIGCSSRNIAQVVN